MKEQWKKLDSNAKLLVNVEEGRPLPVIEIPISAFVSNSDNCCKRLLTVLRVLAVAAFLIILTWIATILYAYCYSQSTLDFEKSAFLDLTPIHNGDEKFSFGDEIYQSKRDDKHTPANVIDAVKEPHHDSTTTESSLIAEKKVSLFAEEPGFVDIPNNVNQKPEEWQELMEKMKKVDKLLQGLAEEKTSDKSAEQVNYEKVMEKAPREHDFFDKTVYEIIRSVIPFGEDAEEEAEEDDDGDKITEITDESFGDSRTKTEKTEGADEIANVLMQLVNSIALFEQVGDDGYTEVSDPNPSPNLDSPGKHEDDNSSDEEMKETALSSETSNKVSDKGDTGSTAEERSEEPDKTIGPLEYATLMSKYLEPIVGENDELLAWYYLGRIHQDSEKEDEPLKFHTAKLLYSSNIAKYPEDMKVVLNLLLLNGEFVRDLKMLSEGGSKLASPDDPKSVQYRIMDRIATKLNMNKLVKEDPKVLEVFSRMIEANNRLELSQMYVNVGDMLFEEIGQSSQDLFVESPEEAERRRLSVLEAIRKVASDDDDDDGDTPSVDDFTTDDKNLAEENRENSESEEKVNVIVDATKNVANVDESVKFAANATNSEDKVLAVEKSAEFVAQESGEEQKSAEDASSTSASQDSNENDPTDNSDDQEESLDTNMNEYLQVYGDFYDY